MKLIHNIYEVVFVGSNKEAMGFLLDKENAGLVSQQILRVQEGECAMYVFSTVEGELYAIAADSVTAIKLKVHTDAEDVGDTEQKETTTPPTINNTQKDAPKRSRPRLVGLDQSS